MDLIHNMQKKSMRQNKEEKKRMRLIDVEMLTDGKGVFNEVIHADFDRIGGGYIKLEDLVNVLDAQPTAYDVDKVVEQLGDMFEKTVGEILHETGSGFTIADFNISKYRDRLTKVVRVAGKESEL